MEKIFEVMKKAAAYVQSLNFSGEAMRYIVWYAATLVLCCVVYLAAWAVTWYTDGRPNLTELRAFLHEIASSPWVAAIGFIGKAFVDRDKDGVPDVFENDDRRSEPPERREREHESN